MPEPLFALNGFRKKNCDHTAAGCKSEPAVDVNVCVERFILSMIAVYCFHNGAGSFDIDAGILFKIAEKMILQGNFIFSVVSEICRKGVIMRICKRIRNIMDQLSQCIVIERSQFLLPLQSPGDAAPELPLLEVEQAETVGPCPMVGSF